MRFTRLSAVISLTLLCIALTYQLASKPATAQGVMYALSGKAAKSATAKPLVFAVRSAARIIAAPEALT